MANLMDVDYTRRSKELADAEERIQAQRRSSVRKAYRELDDNSQVRDDASADNSAGSAVDEDTTMADGVSLAMGSTEYREMVYDRLGYDELEQERLASEIDQRGEREGQVAEQEADDWHEEYRAERAVEHDNAEAEHMQRSVTRQPRRTKGFEHLLKEAAADKALHGLAGVVSSTATQSDDRKLREVKRELEDLGKSHSDFIEDAGSVRDYANEALEDEMG